MISWISIVEEFDRYFFPASGGGWPRTPPNYMAFRWSGHLQSVRHVDDYTIVTNPREAVPEWPDQQWDPHFVLTLGRPIRPAKPTGTGSGIHRSMRVWADIDLLLT